MPGNLADQMPPMVREGDDGPVVPAPVGEKVQQEAATDSCERGGGPSMAPWATTFDNAITVLSVALMTISAATIPLMFPVGDVDTSVADTAAFWFVYKPVVITAYGIAAFQRLRRLLVRSSPPRLELPRVEDDPWGWVAVLCITPATMATYLAMGMMWGLDKLDVSYILLYGGPLLFVVADNLYVNFCIPKRLRTMKVNLFVAASGNALSAPAFLAYVGLITSYLVSSYSPLILTAVVLLNAGLRSMTASGVVAFHSFAAKKAGLDDRAMESGLSLLVTAVYNMADLVMLPSTAPLFVVMGSVVGCFSGQAIMYVKLRRLVSKAAPESEPRSPPAEVALDTTSPAYVDRALERQLETIPAYAALSADDSKTVRWILHTMLDRHLCSLILPVAFAACYANLIRNGNAAQYYLYECVDSFDHTAIMLAVVAEVVLAGVEVVVDYFILKSLGLGQALAQMYSCRLKNQVGLTTASLCWSALGFTSCWLIKHDGLKSMEFLSKPCHP